MLIKIIGFILFIICYHIIYYIGRGASMSESERPPIFYTHEIHVHILFIFSVGGIITSLFLIKNIFLIITIGIISFYITPPLVFIISRGSFLCPGCSKRFISRFYRVNINSGIREYFCKDCWRLLKSHHQRMYDQQIYSTPP